MCMIRHQKFVTFSTVAFNFNFSRFNSCQKSARKASVAANIQTFPRVLARAWHGRTKIQTANMVLGSRWADAASDVRSNATLEEFYDKVAAAFVDSDDDDDKRFQEPQGRPQTCPHSPPMALGLRPDEIESELIPRLAQAYN
ncbi:unnamed protein product [Cyclocybe aegerita]|uniref:Uncharacterized protein n=1 Tax=Cyclocybe aegerita TaxID=1973307 RepID=A0A8S0WR67_CYCAE|nr:unnamed protein product [Cyclocybe aegerita]